MLSTAFSDEGYKAVVPAVPNTLENSRCTVACISNSSTTLNDLKTYLSDEVFSVISIQDSVKALTEIVRLNPDIIIADARLEKINGYQLCELLRQHPSFKAVPVFLMLDESDQIGSKKVCRSGITETLVKPFNQTSLIVKLFPYLGEWPGSKKADLG
ncbi:MAG: response regulator [Cyanobacteria bacterium J06614_10]